MNFILIPNFELTSNMDSKDSYTTDANTSYSTQSYTHGNTTSAGTSEVLNTATIITTIIIILISIPSIRSFALKIISYPYTAIRILSTTYEERESEADDTIRDDDDDESAIPIRENPKVGSLPSIFFRIWTVLVEQLKFIVEFLNSITGFRLGFGGRIVLGDREVDNDRSGDGSWSRSKPVVSQGNTRKTLQNIVMPLNDGSFPPSTKDGNKMREVSFDINSLEPTFLHEEDYPEDWMEYDPIKGALVRRKDRIISMKSEKKAQAVEINDESKTLNETTCSDA